MTDNTMGFDDEHREAAMAIIGLPLEDAKKVFAEKYPLFKIVVVWSDGVSLGCGRYLDFNTLMVGLVDGLVQYKYNISRDEEGHEISYSMLRWG